MNSETKTDKATQLFEEAMNLRDNGNFQAALDKLNEILSKNTKYDAAVLGVMGNIYWDLKDWAKSLACYEKAVALAPKSELASLGFFHTLWNLERIDEAFDEMKRFLSISKSEEYARLLKEINESSKKDKI